MMKQPTNSRCPIRRIGRNRNIAGGLACLLAVLALLGCGERNGAGDEADLAEPDASSSAIMAFGTVVAAERQEIHLPWACRVLEVPVWEGQRVVQGDVLAILDSADLSAAMEDARQNAESARGLAQEAASRLSALEVAVTEARERLHRNLQLRQSGSVSAQDVATIQAEYDGLVHDRAAQSYALKALSGEADKAERDYGRLRDRSADPSLEGNALVCPFAAAVVAEIAVRPGAEADVGDLVVVLHDEASLVVEADLPEEFVRDVSVGSPAVVVPLADPDRRYDGTILDIAGLARLVNGENVVKTRVRLGNPDGFLREGFNVDVEIEPVDQDSSLE